MPRACEAVQMESKLAEQCLFDQKCSVCTSIEVEIREVMDSLWGRSIKISRRC